MKIHAMSARKNWKARAEEFGYLSSILDNPPYWVEALPEPFTVAFEMAEIEKIEAASEYLYQLCLNAVDFVVNSDRSDELMQLLRIPQSFREAIRVSWNRGDMPLYGRFDFGYRDGQVKLFELNFDTPTSLYEASVLQWFWLQDLKAGGVLKSDADQFNSLHETLVEAFRKVAWANPTLHLASIADAPEDEETVLYLQSCATEAKLHTRFLHMDQLGADSVGQLVDLQGDVITQLFKLYPWEYLIREEEVFAHQHTRVFTQLIENNRTRFLEPAWKLLLSNKAMLQILYEIEPTCEYLLPACVDDDASAFNSVAHLRDRAHARKPIFGREGANVSLHFPGAPEHDTENGGMFGAEGYVLQEYFKLPEYDGYHLMLGSWIVDGKPCGMGVRADKSAVTTNRAIFVPHYIEG